jgi:hypothetical protein
LKLGVYTDLSDYSCGTGPGSKGHYTQDATTFAHWKVDYLKVDFCGPFNDTQGSADMTPLAQSCQPVGPGLPSGGHLLRENMTAAAAIQWCASNSSCAGFATDEPAVVVCGQAGGGGAAGVTASEANVVREFYFKKDSISRGNPWHQYDRKSGWSWWQKPGTSAVNYDPAMQHGPRLFG